MNKDVTVSPPKSSNTRSLQEISVNTLHHRMNGSSHKKSLRKRLSISDEESKDNENWGQFGRPSFQNCSKIVKYISFEDEEVDRKDQIYLEQLPCELHRVILSYLPWSDLLEVIQLLSRHWRELLIEKEFWKLISETQPLNLSKRIRKVECLAERRSKGKLFKAINRIDDSLWTVRKIYLDVTNAGRDDGLPTSVLRELSHLKSLEHSNIAK